MGAKELLEQALKLAPDERFALADQVLHSLDRPDPAIDAVWLKEAETDWPRIVPARSKACRPK
jgi:hypothetical protein